MYYLDNRAYVFRSYEVICDAAFELIHSSKHGNFFKASKAQARLLVITFLFVKNICFFSDLCPNLVFFFIGHTFWCLLPIICPCQQCRVEIYSTQMHFDKKMSGEYNSSNFNVGIKS